jgi:hypothetical protein
MQKAHSYRLYADRGQRADWVRQIQFKTSLFVPNGDKKSESIYCRDENYTIISADYSQIELRIIAALSGEENMIKAKQWRHS